MDLKTISLFLTLIALAQCDNKAADDVIGHDSELVDISNEDASKEGRAAAGDNDEENLTNERAADDVTNEDVTSERKAEDAVSEERVAAEDSTKEAASREGVTQEDDTEETSPNRRFFHLLPRKKCPCFPGNPNGKPISHYLLPSPGTKYERLVVYFYKNTATNEVKIYVPNAARQIVFPDIIYDRGDVLNTLNENVIEIITKHFGVTINSWLSHANRPHKPELNLEIVGNLNKKKLHAIFLYLKRYKEARQVLSSLTGSTIIEKLIQLKKLYPNIYKGLIAKITKFYPKWLISGQVKKYKPGRLINFPYDINLILGLIGKQVNEIIVYRPPNIDVSLNYPVITTDVSYDKWLNIFIGYLNSQLQFASKAIDSTALKTLVLKILNKIGFTISQNGFLLDTAGNIINWANIVLRPILIGESVLIDNVINNGLFKIPMNIVFIEVLLISGRQSKVLGLIPIGEIFVGSRQVEVSTVVEIIETTVTCEGGKCIKVKKCKNLKGEEIKCQNTGNSDITIQPRKTIRISPRSIDERSGSLYHKCKKNQPCPLLDNGLFNNNNGLYIIERDQNDGIIHPIPITFKLRQGRFPDDDTYRGRSGYNNVVYLQRSAPANGLIPGVVAKQGNPVYVEDSDEVPGIRIVGGGPATSSGTPVSSKGRSGIPEVTAEE
ncbi:unnamed protein product [Colias eurytheme]|nr:unnamed protein product [Colias eurytheme]